MKAIRPYQNKESLMWIDKVANVYFHLNTKCLKKFDPKLNLKKITMTDEMFYKMTDRHLKLLAEVGVLKYIIANKGADVQQVSIYYYYYLRSVTGASHKKKCNERSVAYGNRVRYARSTYARCMNNRIRYYGYLCNDTCNARNYLFSVEIGLVHS